MFGTLCILPVFTPLSLSCLQDYRESTAASPALLLQARKVSCLQDLSDRFPSHGRRYLSGYNRKAGASDSCR